MKREMHVPEKLKIPNIYVSDYFKDYHFYKTHTHKHIEIEDFGMSEHHISKSQTRH